MNETTMKNVFAQWGGPKMVQVVKTTGVRAGNGFSAVQRPKSIKMEVGPPTNAPNRASGTHNGGTTLGGHAGLAKEEKNEVKTVSQKVQRAPTLFSQHQAQVISGVSSSSHTIEDMRAGTRERSSGKASVSKAPWEDVGILNSQRPISSSSAPF